MSLLLGCIADDFTGATDLANTLVRNGMRAVQLIGAPGPDTPVPTADSVVVALKSRTCPAADAVELSLRSLAWLRAAGARQFFFKYGSTFDSTDSGNIGPVAEALMGALNADLAPYCPAFPETGRTVYRGHLFVGDVLLSESGMERHPLTPMTDSDLVGVLGRQTMGPVGLVPWPTISQGAAAIVEALAGLRAEAVRHVVVDAIADADLAAIGRAVADLPLVTGGSGVARGLPGNFRRAGLLSARNYADALPAANHHRADRPYEGTATLLRSRPAVTGGGRRSGGRGAGLGAAIPGRRAGADPCHRRAG